MKNVQSNHAQYAAGEKALQALESSNPAEYARITAMGDEAFNLAVLALGARIPAELAEPHSEHAAAPMQHNVCYAPRCNNAQLPGQCVCAVHATMVKPAHDANTLRAQVAYRAPFIQRLINDKSEILRFAQMTANRELWTVEKVHGETAAWTASHDGKVVECYTSEAHAWAYVFEILSCII